jgi:hypothetical protein
VAGDVRCRGAGGLGLTIERPRDMPVQQLSPWLGEGAIGGLPNEIVSEVMSVAADRAHESAPLEVAERGKKSRRIEARGARELVRREGAAMCRRPDERVAHLIRQRGELAGDDGLHGAARPGIAPPPRAGKLQRKQRMAVALGEDARRIQRRIDAAD